MTRNPPPDSRVSETKGEGRQPWEYESELAKYEAIRLFIDRCGDLSDVTDIFHHYDARWNTLTKKSGLARPYRLGMYRHYKKNSLNHLRMAVNEIVRLLSQPKIILHGSDFIRDDTKEPGFWGNVVNGAKKMLGMKTEESRPTTSGDVGNGKY